MSGRVGGPVGGALACAFLMLFVLPVTLGAPRAWLMERTGVIYLYQNAHGAGEFYATADEACEAAMPPPYDAGDTRITYASPSASAEGCLYRVTWTRSGTVVEVVDGWLGTHWYTPYQTCQRGFELVEDGCRRARPARGRVCPLGNPVYPDRGFKSQLETDYRDEGLGDAGLSFARQYASLHMFPYAGPLGRHWFMARFGRFLRFVTEDGARYVEATRALGDVHLFTLRQGVWSSEPYDADRLEQLAPPVGEAVWRYHAAARGETELYDAEGRLLSLTTGRGEVYTLSYSDAATPPEIAPFAGLLIAVADSRGRLLQFRYDASGLLSTMYDPAGREYRYAYMPVRLTAQERRWVLASVTYPDGHTRRYHYEAQLIPQGQIAADSGLLDNVMIVDPDVIPDIHANTVIAIAGENDPLPLTGITDERGIRYATYQYDAEGRATVSSHAGDAGRVAITYNPDGSRTVTNSRGIETVYTFTEQHGVALVSAIRGPGCAACGAGGATYQYDAANNLIALTAHGFTTLYGDYDNKGQYGYKIEAAGTPQERRFDYTYDARFFHKVTSISEASVAPGLRKVTRYSYDAFGNLTSRSVNGYRPDGTAVSRTTRYRYDGPLHQLSLIDGPRSDVNDVIRYEYHPYTAYPAMPDPNNGRLLRVTGPTGVLRDNIQYTPTGRIASEDRPNGLHLSYTYTPRDRLETLTQTDTVSGDSHTTRWTYLPSGEVATLTLADGTPEAVTLSFSYDDARRLTGISDGLGNTIAYTLDTEGNRVAEAIHDTGGVLRRTLSRTFDIYNHLDVLTQGNETIDYDFAPDGTLDLQRDGNGIVTDYSYDALRRLTQVVQDFNGSEPATGNVRTHYEYDAASRLTAVTDPNGNATRYVYDDLGNLLSRTSPDTGTTTYRYDEAGNLIRRTDANGTTVAYAYDAANRLLHIDAPGNEDDIHFVYDDCPHGRGHLCRIDRGAAATPQRTDYAYNAWGGITRHQGMGYTYDRAGRLARLVYPSAAQVHYTRNAAGRVVGLDLELHGRTIPLVTHVSHAPFGPPTRLDYGNGLSLLRPLDQAYRYRDITVPGIGGYRDLQYDPTGNLRSYQDARTGALQSYSYDPLGRLVGAWGRRGSWRYEYDANGNRISLNRNESLIIGMRHDTHSNRLIQVADDAVMVDEAGDTRAQGARRYSYNAYHELTGVTENGRRLATYQYNGLGQRIGKQSRLRDTDYADQAARYQALAEQREAAARDALGEADAATGQAEALAGEAAALNGKAEGLRTQAAQARRQAEAYRDSQAGYQSQIEAVRAVLATLEGLVPRPFGDAFRQWVQGFIEAARQMIGGYIADLEGRASSEGMRAEQARVRAEELSEEARDLTRRAAELERQSEGHARHAEALRQEAARLQDAAREARARAASLVHQMPLEARRFGYDIAGHLVVERSGEGEIVGEIIYLEDLPVALLRGWAVYYIHSDHLGTPYALTDGSGQVVWRADYAPFGQAEVDEDPDGDGNRVTFNLRFPGQYYDAETGLHYNYFRYYDPATGRFITSDPIGLEGGLNSYLYANANPLFYTDPLGLFSAADLPTIPQPIVDAVTGFGDAFLIPELVRDALDIDGGVNKCSAAYRGGKVGGFITGGAPFLLRGAAAAGATRFGHVLNHNRFFRVGPGRMPRNGGLPPGTHVPRASVGPQRPGIPNPHFDLRSRIPYVPPVGGPTTSDDCGCQ